MHRAVRRHERARPRIYVPQTRNDAGELRGDEPRSQRAERRAPGPRRHSRQARRLRGPWRYRCEVRRARRQVQIPRAEPPPGTVPLVRHPLRDQPDTRRLSPDVRRGDRGRHHTDRRTDVPGGARGARRQAARRRFDLRRRGWPVLRAPAPAGGPLLRLERSLARTHDGRPDRLPVPRQGVARAAGLLVHQSVRPARTVTQGALVTMNTSKFVIAHDALSMITFVTKNSAAPAKNAAGSFHPLFPWNSGTRMAAAT